MADFSGSDPIIYREPLQTEQYDSLSLNGKLFTTFPAPIALRALVVIENVGSVMIIIVQCAFYISEMRATRIK